MNDEELHAKIRDGYAPPELSPRAAAEFDARVRSATEGARTRPRWVYATAVFGLALAALIALGRPGPRVKTAPVDWLTPALAAYDDEAEDELPADYETLALILAPIEEEI